MPEVSDELNSEILKRIQEQIAPLTCVGFVRNVRDARTHGGHAARHSQY
jgi:hypothetical protein